MSKALIAVVVIIAIVLLVVLVAFGQYVGVKNTLVSKNEAVKAAWDQAEKVSGIRIKAIPQSSIATETHEKIVVNRHFSAADFAR